jgi:hypothetical protein
LRKYDLTVATVVSTLKTTSPAQLAEMVMTSLSAFEETR